MMSVVQSDDEMAVISYVLFSYARQHFISSFPHSPISRLKDCLITTFTEWEYGNLGGKRAHLP